MSLPRRIRVPASLLVAVSLVTVGLVSLSTQPVLAGTQMVSEPFLNSTLGTPADWARPAAVNSGTNAACLTVGGSATTPLPDCSNSGGDAAGHGALELTNTGTGEEGGLAYSVSLPTSDGLDASFDTYQYGGSGADGIAFFLAAANPSDPTPPAVMGQTGGALGYSGYNGNNGMTDAYLAVGFDAYGNFANSLYEGSGCSNPSWRTRSSLYPENVTVRGPGDNFNGYCLLTSTAADGGHSWQITGGSGGTRSSSMIPVEVVINPSDTAISTLSGLNVPASPSWSPSLPSTTVASRSAWKECCRAPAGPATIC